MKNSWKFFVFAFLISIFMPIAVAMAASSPDWRYVCSENGIKYSVNMNGAYIGRIENDYIAFFVYMIDDPRDKRLSVPRTEVNLQRSEWRWVGFTGYTRKGKFYANASGKNFPTPWIRVVKNSAIANILVYLMQNHPAFK